MKQVSELLRQAQGGAPPARFGVDDVVAAGRRRVRRRNAGWAVAAAVAVALVIGAPQVLARPDAGRPVLPVAPPSEAPRHHPMSFLFRGYTVGDLRVAEPDTLLRLYQISAAVNRNGQQVGTLTLHPPGVEITDLYDRSTATERVNGRPAFLVEGGFGGGTLAWETAGNRIAVLDAATSESEAREIAGRFALGGGEPARFAFKVGHVPDDYRLISVRATSDESLALLVPVAEAEKLLADPAREPAPGPVEMISIRVSPEAEEPRCGSGSTCESAIEYGYRLEVQSQGAPPVEVREIFKSITRAGTSAWYSVDEAFPASARL